MQVRKQNKTAKYTQACDLYQQFKPAHNVTKMPFARQSVQFSKTLQMLTITKLGRCSQNVAVNSMLQLITHIQSIHSVYYSIAYIAVNANVYNKEYTKQTQTDTQTLEYCG